MLHSSLYHTVPTSRSTRAVRVTLVDRRMLWFLQPTVPIPNRLLARVNSLCLLHGEQPALARGAVGAVIGARAGHEEAGICLDVDAWADLSVAYVVEVLWRVRGDGINTLGTRWEGGERKIRWEGRERWEQGRERDGSRGERER